MVGLKITTVTKQLMYGGQITLKFVLLKNLNLHWKTITVNYNCEYPQTRRAKSDAFIATAPKKTQNPNFRLLRELFAGFPH